MKYYKIILLTILVYILAGFTTYFSMHEYSREVSSSCFTCSYKRDVFILSSFPSLVFLIMLLVKNGLKKKWNLSVYFIIAFIFLVFVNNYHIFTDRVSAWSSYTFYDEIIRVLLNSYLYFTLSTVVLFMLLRRFKF